MRAAVYSVGCLLLMISSGALAGAPSSPLPTASAESVGMSKLRLDGMTRHFQREVARGSTAGYVLLVARDGKLVHQSAIGERNVEQHVPMTLETRFRLASMTKPVTSVAVLMLYEDGRLQLNDPVSRYLPEFAQPRVYTGIDGDGNVITEAARREITVRDLLTHSSGLGYGPGFDAKHPLAKLYGSVNFNSPGSLADKVNALAALPLYFHPGEGWRYSYAHDVLGRLVEVVSGKPFPEFLAERLFVPLGMTATGFHVAEQDRPLLATMYTHNGAETGIQPSTRAWYGDAADASRAPSGGGGLISTAGDYLRFAQMLANGGTLEGRRYLAPTTVALMTQNAVPTPWLAQYWGPQWGGYGYGLGVGIEVDPAHEPYAGEPGDYSWGGVFDTHWLVSPKTGIVAVLLTQVDPLGTKVPQRTDVDFHNLLYAAVTALEPPSKLSRR